MGLAPGPPGANLSCVSYKHPSVRGSLGGGGTQGGAPSTVRCPPRQCCIGIWNRSQALVQGCWGAGGPPAPLLGAPPAPPAPPGPPSSSASATATSATATPAGGARGWGGWGGPPHTAPPPATWHPRGPCGCGARGPPLLLFLACLALLGLRRARAQTKRPPRGRRGLGAPPEPPSPELPALRFLQVLQAGRFSAVWRGTLQQRPVAIKAFAAGAAGRFAAERAVHALPLMEHDNVARLLGARGGSPCARGGLLVLQLYPAGSLRHFLRQHVGTWAGSVRLALSLARGLAFLHQELWRDGLYKPSVVHRDLSSQNVLVREDGTCAIGDFGLALALPPRAQAGSGGHRAVPIRKAGTQRYLAPEILDESLDLRSWGRALRQADVYALALLLWEILSRCQALSPGAPVPEFRLAYEAELGASPTAAQLRRLAVDERRRPLIPPAWHQPPGAVQELLEDCWDPDPEARLSAERALQRLQRLAAAPPPPEIAPPPRPPRSPAPPPRFLPGGAAPGAEAAEVPELPPRHVGPPRRAAAPPQPHVPPPAPPLQPCLPAPPLLLPPPHRGPPVPPPRAAPLPPRDPPVPPWDPPVSPGTPLIPPRRPPLPPWRPFAPPGVPPPAPPPFWGALPGTGQEGGEEAEEEDEEGSEEAQALFVVVLLLLQQRLRLMGPPVATSSHQWPPNVQMGPPRATQRPPGTTHLQTCPPGPPVSRGHPWPPVATHLQMWPPGATRVLLSPPQGHP